MQDDTARAQFRDPTFLDAVIRRRTKGLCGEEADKLRLCWLLADAVVKGCSTDREKVLALQRWICAAVPHTYHVPDFRGRGDTGSYYYMRHALDHIAYGWGCCEPTAETFATLAWLIGFPARTLSIHRFPDKEGHISGHHINEVFLEGKWSFIDADLLRCFEIEDGTLGSVVELKERRHLIDAAEDKWMSTAWEGEYAFLNDWKRPFQDERGKSTYSTLFESSVYIQEGIWSLDHYYGRWLKWGADTHDYLYGPPQHPETVEALRQGKSPIGSRVKTQVEAYFQYDWQPPDW